MSKVIRNISGTYDVLPDVSSTDAAYEDTTWKWQFVEDRIRDVMARFTFREIRTPILEPTELISRGVGQLTDIVSKEMFAFEREGTHYVLRPEVTAPVMRAYLQHNLAQLGGVQKLYYMGPCFRAERPQRGRYRQFQQFGCEIIGTEAVYADLEAISLMTAIYNALGITNTRLFINSLGNAESRPQYKLALQEYLLPYVHDLSETSQRRLKENPLRILDTKNPKERELLADAPLLINYIDGQSRKDYEKLKELLGLLDIAFEENPFLVRGLDYYTHTAFELESEDLGAQSALGGGGRYDLLSLEVGSKKPVPAVGFACGMERLLIAMKAQNASFQKEVPPDVFLLALGDKAQEWVAKTSFQLREQGLKVAVDLKGRSMKAQMREANRLGVVYTVIVGEDEMLKEIAVVKSMQENTQVEVHFDDLSAYLERATV